jgi:hypothetical protein
MVAGKCPRCGKRVAYTVVLNGEIGCVNCSGAKRSTETWTYVGQMNENKDVSVYVRDILSPTFLIAIPVVYVIVAVVFTLIVR